jgi:competence ComEA-like helix-hairpin-helix protein
VLTKDERRALIFLAVVTAAGGVIRATRGAAPGSVAAAVAPDLPGEDLVAQAALSRQAEAAQRPLAPGERVDVDRASEAELERLPRVGKRLAQRIVADRQAGGPFRSLAGLGRVPGVSAGLLRVLAPWVSFGGAIPAAAVSPFSAYPGQAAAAPAAASSAAATRSAGVACAAEVAVNRATREELLCLPGIGAVLAARIVAERDAHGPFRDIADLARVPGIGPARIEHLKGHVTIP